MIILRDNYDRINRWLWGVIQKHAKRDLEGLTYYFDSEGQHVTPPIPDGYRVTIRASRIIADCWEGYFVPIRHGVHHASDSNVFELGPPFDNETALVHLDEQAGASMSQKDYVERHGNHCPVCGSDMIYGEAAETGNGRSVQEMGCHQCHATWNDVYQLIGFSDLERPEHMNFPEVEL